VNFSTFLENEKIVLFYLKKYFIVVNTRTSRILHLEASETVLKIFKN